ELCKFGKSLEQKAVIFSDDDHAILNISQHQERLEKYFLFDFPPPLKVKKLLDKQLFCEIIERYNLPAPKSATISTVQEIADKKISEFNFPCIIKPSFKQAWWNSDFDKKVGDYQKAIKCDSFGEMLQKYKQIAEVNPHIVVQEFIE